MWWCGVCCVGSVAWCGVVWCGVVWCGVVWCGVKNHGDDRDGTSKLKMKAVRCLMGG